MTRSKRARRLARREYAERHPGQPPVRTVQPTAASGVNRSVRQKSAKQKARKPFYARPEVKRALYAAAGTLVLMLMVYGFVTWQRSSAIEITPTATAVSNNTTSTGNSTRKQYSAPPPMTIDPTKTYNATIETDKGNVKVELFAKDEPKTVNNFVFLAREGFYDGLTFHRVLPGFVAQGGDPKGDGTGGPGYSIEDEFGPRKHVVGALAMAHSVFPNSAGSQFYITLAERPDLDGKYAVFGQVTDGMDVAQKITPRDPDQKPIFAGDKIRRITIEEK